MMLQPKDIVKAFTTDYQQLYKEKSCPGKMQKTKSFESINVIKLNNDQITLPMTTEEIKKAFWSSKTTNLQTG